jgi:formamidopyrimidine-DNA glycosylase
MPELPEVEHVVRGLRRAVLGGQILAAEINLPKTLASPAPATFKRKLRGARIDAVNRRGKYILIELDTQDVLVVHLRMTGKFVVLNPEQQLSPYAHVVFYLDDERRLGFCDMRQFGRIRLLAKSKMAALPQLESLAPEPLTTDFSTDYLQEMLAKSKRSLKQLLLDQTRILGLGNIYASEALYLARISPFKESHRLSKARTLKLHQAIRDVLEEAIAAGSTLRIDLADGVGSYFETPERFWRVYERNGEPCVRCGAKIRRAVQGARSTYYCPKCQKT